MRRAALTALLFVALTGTAAGSTQRLTGSSPYSSAPAMAVDDTGSVTAVLYGTSKGLRVRVSRGGRPFGRPLLVTRHRRGVEALRVAVTRTGRVLAAWERDDRSAPEDEYARDDGCCTRIHAAVLAPSGRRSGPRRLSPAGMNASLTAVALGSGNVAVSWQRGEAHWYVRSGRSLRAIGRRRAILRGWSVVAGALRWRGGRLTAVGATPARSGRTRVRVLAARAQERFRTLGRPAVVRGDAFDGTFSIAASGRISALLVTLGPSPLVTGRPSRLRAARAPSRAALAAAPSGAALLVGTTYHGTRGRVRARPPRGRFSRPRRLRLARHPVSYDAVVPAVGSNGRGAVWSQEYHRGSNSVYLTPIRPGGRPGSLRRVRRFGGSRSTYLHAAAFDRGGTLALVGNDRHLDVIRP